MSYQENNLQYGKVLYPSPVTKERCFSSPIVSSSNAEIVLQCESMRNTFSISWTEHFTDEVNVHTGK